MTKEELNSFVISKALKDYIEVDLEDVDIADVTNRVDALVVLFQSFVKEMNTVGIKLVYQLFPEYKALQEVFTDEQLGEMGIPALTDANIEHLRSLGHKI